MIPSAPPSSATIVAPISAGLRATRTPAASNAAILSAAVPRPPAMIAPACPMRRPGGAVCPATKATTGLFMWSRMNSAACSSAVPPISPIMMTASVSGSSWNRRSASTKLVPLIGSPPMPMQVDCPWPSCVSWMHGLVGQRAAARHHADAARLVDVPRHDADLALARRDDARAVGTDQARRAALEEALDAHHIEHRNALGDADDRAARRRRPPP